jgi:hypothetical protein
MSRRSALAFAESRMVLQIRGQDNLCDLLPPFYLLVGPYQVLKHIVRNSHV